MAGKGTLFREEVGEIQLGTDIIVAMIAAMAIAMKPYRCMTSSVCRFHLRPPT
jgi:hypothetical protein